ncbi:helix-turn-helix transcriptional regulator [Bacillus massiliigorillae]|uniref:helix-turn-helix transcriptional regulator n=1 Tax=Bacillus massiliigorillae TaxID=1243664 RepID=UPI0003A46D83|nr:helix-turn-helix transcriptional regulator [Bacillus massiliigorillae]
MKNSNLIKARKAVGLTQSDLASKLNYTKQAVSNWENGYSTPRILDAIKISEILNKDINHLFLESEVQENHTNSA